MRFDDRFLEEIKSRLRPSDVIGRTVKLRRSGREYVGLSPFSKERTPSFYVNDEKGFFHDFSSGKHGDLISFLQETERLSFPEAVERLAAEAGVALPAPDPRAAETERKRAGLGDWLDTAAAWFEAQLRRPAGEGARAYLDRRALPEAERARFRIGYAPAGRTALKDYLIAKGAKPAELVEAGLLIAPDQDKPGDGGAPYDRFRDRIMFPITDLRGRIVSFGGRALDPDAKAKYLNGPDTELFHKGQLLYGLHEARRLLHAGGEGAALVVVEGYMDVIACQRAGIAAAAPLGTALTEEQMAALWRLHPEPTLCFDADAAGARAAARSIDRALPLLKPGRSFQFALITGGKDPDDVLREQGPKALKDQLAQTRPLVEVLFERERDLAQPLDTPERRTALKVGLRKLAGVVADPELSHAYREDLLRRYEALWPVVQPVYTRADAARAMRGERRGLRRGLGPAPIGGASEEGKAARRKLSARTSPAAAAVAKTFLEHVELVERHCELLDVQGFGDPALKALADEIVRAHVTSPDLDSAHLHRQLISAGFEALVKAVVEAAAVAHVPFVKARLSPEEVSAVWSHIFLEVLRLSALERAVDDVKSDIATQPDRFTEPSDLSALYDLKAQRDALRRELGWGTNLADATSSDKRSSLH